MFAKQMLLKHATFNVYTEKERGNNLVLLLILSVNVPLATMSNYRVSQCTLYKVLWYYIILSLSLCALLEAGTGWGMAFGYWYKRATPDILLHCQHIQLY